MFNSEQLIRLREIAAGQLPASSSTESHTRAHKFLDESLISSVQFGDQPFENGQVWSASSTRANERYLHGFLFFADWSKTVLQSGNERCEDSARATLAIITRWADLHPSRERSSRMSYHDETTAQRLINMISVYPALVRTLGLQAAAPVHDLMAVTASLLARDDFHAGNNNHGMFQDLSLLYYSLLCAEDPETTKRYFELSLRRLRQYFSTCYTPDGVHVENTPTYHLLVSRQLANVQKLVRAAGHEDADYYGQLVLNAETYAAHALMPNGVYPPISDTQQIPASKSGMGKLFPGSSFEYASSQGQKGVAPESRVLVLPDSGYAIYRSSWGDPDAVYAFFSAAYNADYHKHSDDLSFFLRSKGIDLLSESGPYGYDYKHPFSRYAYSQFSHNSLIVDGVSLPRTDGLHHKVRLFSEAETRTDFTVLGTNERYQDTIHSRRLQVRENDGVPSFSLTDTIISSQTHKYQLLWNLGVEVRAHLTTDGFDLTHGHTKVMELRFKSDAAVALSVHEGVETPRPLGWRFPRFGQAVQTQVVVFDFEGTTAELVTDIKLSNFGNKLTTRSAGPAEPITRHQAGPHPYTIEADPATSSISIVIDSPLASQTAFRLYRDQEPVSIPRYSSSREIVFTNLPEGRYRARVFTRQNSESESAIFTTTWVQL